ncbi:MAG TPA: polynucleotide adenylyltransferase PcnB [Thermoanaerobaculia bacterium]|nr:polynucleotide adenylyltransferase PcnB [Thermoanaerobaculia bacterium]
MTAKPEEHEVPGGELEHEPLEENVPRIVERADHPISRRDVPETVLKVLYRLHRSGYRAYLCGGSVRDLLMRRTPKDFDIATDAHPNDVRRLFRNSRVIGRRFRLAHVIFQERIVEVSTFRREPQRQEGEDLLVTDDNTFGTPAEDARRRDFTINGLFYNIADFTVLDYVGGLEDLREGLIRVIGEPGVRFREDPVRMLRAVEFAARLDFEIEAATWDAILEHRSEILKASPARVSEEILELLRRGWSLAAIELLAETRLLEPLLPELQRPLDEGGIVFFWTMLDVLDRTVRSGRKVSDPVLFAVLLLPYIIGSIETESRGRDEKLRVGEMILFVRELIQPIVQRFSFSAAMRHQTEQALETLWRLLEPPSDRRSMWRFVFREPFNDGLALLELYARASGNYLDVAKQWQSFAQRVRSEEPHNSPAPRRKRRRR